MSFVDLNFHLVWSTKNRSRFLKHNCWSDFSSLIGGMVNKRRCKLMAIGGVQDHVHLLVRMHQSVSVADLVRDLKTNSSSWLRDHLKQPKFGWQSKYGAFSVSQSNLDAVKKYIADQEEHHRKRTYHEEFKMLLRKHGIEFDERYLDE